ncbi:MAG: sulfatase [Anaerolineae bacterium]
MHNVVLLTVDCLRADRLGVMGQTQGLTPNLDALVSQSTVFPQAFAVGPRTPESFPAILASTYPLTFNADWHLPEKLTTLAEILQRAGYATAAFHSNPYLSLNLGYGKGFSSFWDSMETTSAVSKLASRAKLIIKRDSTLYRFLRRLARRFETQAEISYYTRAEEVNGRAIKWLQNQQSPFFLWLHYMDLHYPYNPPVSFVQRVRPEGIPKAQQADIVSRSLEKPESITQAETQILEDLYNAGLLYVDEGIGNLLSVLKQLNLFDDTFVFVTADHGEEFLEHGSFGHGVKIHLLKANRPILKLYDELLHVPLVLRSPISTMMPRRVSSLVSLIDLAPTLVDLLDIEEADCWQGISLVPLLKGNVDRLREGVFSEYAVRGETERWPIVSYRTSRWKFVYDGVEQGHELYDLECDPAEQNNIYATRPAILSELESAVHQHLADVRGETSQTTEGGITPEMIERFRGLGYIE